MLPKESRMSGKEKSYLTRKLDVITSLIVRSIGYCEKCGKKENLQCCHIYSRTYKSVRWDFLNLVCLCASCHHWAHKNPILFTEWVKKYRGKELYTELKKRACPTSNWKVYQLSEMYEKYQGIYQEQQQAGVG